MNEEGIKQIELRLEKLKEMYKAIAKGTDGMKVRRWMELSERVTPIRALLYEDFENIGNDPIWDDPVWDDSDNSGMEHRRKLVNLMLSIFKECRK